MPTTPTSVAIYARISSDVEGAGAGVARQLEDCRKKAETMGWGVLGEYVDNDLSAFSGKRRPEYERMLTDLADGLVDGVLVYNIDRLTRQPKELEHFCEVLAAAKVANIGSVTGDIDLTSPDGLLMARVLGAFAAKESANIGRRVSRKMEQNAVEGKPHGGSRRPFGYQRDMVTVIPEEAETIRVLVARFLAGESTRSLATWLTDQGVATVTGGTWQTTTLKAILTNPRYAGLRAHKGVVVGPAVWDPIITETDHRRVLARFAEKKMSGRRAPRRYLLSGLLRCHKCNNRMFSSARQDMRRYVCMSGPDHGGCGGTLIVADPVERLVTDAVLFRLDTPELADVLAGRSSTDARTQELTRALDETQVQLEELSLAWANRDISMREWMTAKKPVTARLESVQRQLATLTRTGALAGLVGNGASLAKSWADLNLTRQAAIVAALVDHIVIGPGTPGAQAVDPARVNIVWTH